MMIDNVSVVIDSGTFSVEEMSYYVAKVKLANKKLTLRKLTLAKKERHIDLRIAYEGVALERLRRLELKSPLSFDKAVSR